MSNIIKYDKLDIDKFYCNQCFKEGIINELETDLKENDGLIKPECGHYKRGFCKLSYI